MYPGFLVILAYPIIALAVIIIMAIKREWTIVALLIAVHLLLWFAGPYILEMLRSDALYHE